jgi:SAM-dependent methyltransferase
MTAPHTDASRRDSFNRNATTYTAGRPPYPARVYTFMEELGALRPAARILEIGPGTGQATADLLRRGARIDAVELGESLAAQLRERIPDDRLSIRVGDIHTTDLPGRAYDAVVAATTFHWLDTEPLLPRLAAALRPDGWLVVWWTVFGDPHATTAFRTRVDRVFREHLPAEHRPLNAIPRPMQTADRLRELTAGGWFGDVHHEEIRWSYRQDAQQVRALFSTFPAIANVPDDLRAAVLDELSAAVEAEGGVIVDPFVTVVYAARSTRVGES